MASQHFYRFPTGKGLIVFILLCALLTACKKNTDDSGPRLIRSMTIDGNPCKINCLYDDEGRVTSVTQCDTVEQYTHYDDSVVYIRAVGGTLSYKNIYTLDESGIATGYIRIAADGSETEYTFTYDDNGNRTHQTDITNPNTFISYIIENGNTVYDTAASTLGSAGRYTIERAFYIGTENTLSYENFGKTFLGSSSANLKKVETFNSADGQYTIRYTYELDYLNGVSMRVMKVNDSIIETREYEYSGGGD